jgi:hypothetical protein
MVWIGIEPTDCGGIALKTLPFFSFVEVANWKNLKFFLFQYRVYSGFRDKSLACLSNFKVKTHEKASWNNN